MRSKHSLLRFTALATVAVLSLAACNRPIIQDNSKPRTWYGGRNAVITLASRPERRLSFINVVENAKNAEEDRYGNICSEPPADAAESISSTFQAGLEADAKEVKGKAELATSLATAIQALTKRSQGVVLFRDTAFRYCEAYLNGILKEDEYLERLNYTFEKAKELVEMELKANDGKIGYGPFVPLNSPEQIRLASLLAKAERLEESDEADANEPAPDNGTN